MAKKSFGNWFYCNAKFERHFAIVLYTSMSALSGECNPRIVPHQVMILWSTKLFEKTSLLLMSKRQDRESETEQIVPPIKCKAKEVWVIILTKDFNLDSPEGWTTEMNPANPIAKASKNSFSITTPKYTRQLLQTNVLSWSSRYKTFQNTLQGNL